MQLKTTFAALSICVAMTPAGAFAASAQDAVGTFNIAPVLANPEYAAGIAGVKFYFGNEPHPDVAKELSSDRSNKRANGGKYKDGASEKACQRALASAMISFADKAKLLGGDAVIGVESGFGDKSSDSRTTYLCGSGRMMSGMTLTGKIVKLR